MIKSLPRRCFIWARSSQETSAPAPALLAANALNAVVLVATLAQSQQFALAAAWAALVCCVTAYIFLSSRSKAAFPGRAQALDALALGALWAVVPCLFFPRADAAARPVIACLVSGVMFGGAFALADAPLAAAAFAMPTALAFAATLSLERDLANLPIILTLLVYVLALLRGVFDAFARAKRLAPAPIGAQRRSWADPSAMADRAALDEALAADLRHAAALGQFALVYQPILNVATCEIVGCEALLRWRHPTRGAVEPSAFIPIAERNGHIHEIGFWVVENVCAAAAHLPPHFRIALNVSPLQLRRADFAERVLDALSRAQAAPSKIEIEITETALLADDEASDAAIRKLSRAGMSVSLDDFGSGYSSLNYLRKLPLHKVKIDRSFVCDVLTRKDCAAIVANVTRLAADLGMTIVAEGVETIAQLEWLRGIGCREAQGYLISPPLTCDELRVFAADWRPERLARQTQNEISA